MFGCCHEHINCQTVGKCLNERLRSEEKGCALYDNTISTKLPLLYALKEKGLVQATNNHLTEDGEYYLFDKLNAGKFNLIDAHLLMLVIFIIGSIDTGRLFPQRLKLAVQQLKISNGNFLKEVEEND